MVQCVCKLRPICRILAQTRVCFFNILRRGGGIDRPPYSVARAYPLHLNVARRSSLLRQRMRFTALPPRRVEGAEVSFGKRHRKRASELASGERVFRNDSIASIPSAITWPTKVPLARHHTFRVIII